MKMIRATFGTIRKELDRRDLLGAVGLSMLLFGGEQLFKGAGFAASGIVLVAVAVMVR